MLASWKKSCDKLRQCVKKQRHYFVDKGPYIQSCGFSSSHVQTWEVDHKNGWETKNRCFGTMMLEKTFKSPLDSKKIEPVNPKGNQPWIFIGRTDAEAAAPVLWPPDEKSHLIGKILMLGKIEGRMRSRQRRMKQLDGTINSMEMSLNKLWEIVKDREAWSAAAHRVSKSQT